MNQVNRDKVLEYISHEKSSPLVFQGLLEEGLSWDNIGKYFIEGETVEGMVRKVLQYSNKFPSFDSVEGEFETAPGKNRSTLDIWRHIIFFNKEITIFDVMHAIDNIGGNELVGGVCMDIGRRVFKLIVNRRRDTREFSMFNNSYADTDEYGLRFDEWKEI